MAHIPYPPLPSDTIFRRIGDRFKKVADDFNDLSDRIRDVWLIGTWLRWPFYIMYLWFNSLYTLCYLADDKFRDVKRWTDGIAVGNVFRDMLDWLSSQYRRIRTDPIGWVKSTFAAINHDAWRMLNTPHVWVFDKIEGWITWFYGFRTNPVGTIRAFLVSAHPFLSSFLFYPLSYIRERVYEGIGFIRQLRDSPVQTIVDWIARWYTWIWYFLNRPLDFVIDKVKSFRSDVRFFFDNPIGWAKQKIREVMGWTDYDISDIPYYVLKRLLNLASTYVTREYSTIRRVFCDIIMRYM